MATDKTCADCSNWTKGNVLVPAWCGYWQEPAIGEEVACRKFAEKSEAPQK